MLLYALLPASVLFLQGAAGAEEYSYRYQGKEIVVAPDADRVGLKLSPGAAQSGLPLLQLLGSRIALCSPGEAEGLVRRFPQAFTHTLPVFSRAGHRATVDGEILVALNDGIPRARARSVVRRFGGSVAREYDWDPPVFLIRTPDAARDGAFRFARLLGAQPEFAHAEPNFRYYPRPPRPRPDPPEAHGLGEVFDAMANGCVPVASSPPAIERHKGDRVVWDTLLAEDFEGNFEANWQFPEPGILFPDARWGKTDYRKRGGRYSLYCVCGGLDAVPAPGPYPPDAASVAISPALDLTAYQNEHGAVYIEYWVYYVVEEEYYDYGTCLLYDYDKRRRYEIVPDTYVSGDGTIEPGTQDGWQRVLAHVPPSMCGKRMAFAFAFRSDTTYEYEGVYIDDITVWGTRDVDAAPVSNDPYSGRQWALVHSGQLPRGAANPQVPEAWSAVAVSPDLKVAVVDFGIPRPHPDLRIERGWGPNGGDGSPPAGMLFFTEHGTACAGIVGALKDNGEGVAGVAPGVSILPICLVDVDELGLPFWDDAWAAEALRKAVDLGARIVSNSWGGGELSETVHQAFRYGSAKGALFLCSAGNSNWDVEFPAALTADRTVNVVAVGSSSPCDERYGPSCCGGRAYGSCFDAGGGIAPDVVAPGGWIYTTDLPGALGYNGDAFQEGIDLDVTAYFGGTSAACPFAAGVAALMLSKDPALAASAVKGLLRSTADPAGASRETGKGRVNAFKAVQAIAGPSQCDLACKPGSLTFTFNRTEGLSVSVVVTNLGTDPAAAPFDVRILLDAAEVFRESVGELPAGAERSFSKIPYTAARTLQPGEAHAIVVEIDPGKACGERDEDNNSCIASFMVPDIYFKRGDANSDGRMNLADGIFILRYIFSSGDDPTCSYAADANDDGMLTIPDAIAIFQALFTPNSPLAPPGSFACGPDGKADGLRVCVHPPCEGAARRR